MAEAALLKVQLAYRHYAAALGLLGINATLTAGTTHETIAVDVAPLLQASSKLQLLLEASLDDKNSDVVAARRCSTRLREVMLQLEEVRLAEEALAECNARPRAMSSAEKRAGCSVSHQIQSGASNGARRTQSALIDGGGASASPSAWAG